MKRILPLALLVAVATNADANSCEASYAGIWERFENGTRNLAYAGHDVYIASSFTAAWKSPRTG